MKSKVGGGGSAPTPGPRLNSLQAEKGGDKRHFLNYHLLQTLDCNFSFLEQSPSFPIDIHAHFIGGGVICSGLEENPFLPLP